MSHNPEGVENGKHEQTEGHTPIQADGHKSEIPEIHKEEKVKKEEVKVEQITAPPAITKDQATEPHQSEKKPHAAVIKLDPPLTEDKLTELMTII